MHVGFYGRSVKLSVDGTRRAVFDKSDCRITGTETCAVLKLISKKMASENE